jgi:hypothetical protein
MSEQVEMSEVKYLFERIDSKLDTINERLARVEGAIERQDERSLNHNERIVVLEQQQRKATWALVSAGVAVLIALLPIIVTLL